MRLWPVPIGGPVGAGLGAFAAGGNGLGTLGVAGAGVADLGWRSLGVWVGIPAVGPAPGVPAGALGGLTTCEGATGTVVGVAVAGGGSARTWATLGGALTALLELEDSAA